MNGKENPLTIIAELEEKLELSQAGSERLQAYVNLVAKCFHYKQHAKTKTYVVRALVLAKRLNSTKDEAYLNYIAGANLINLSENSLALDYLNKALKNSQNLGNTKLLSDVLDAIGYVYALIGDLDRALEYFLGSIENEGGNIVALNNVGYIYSRLNDCPKALEYLWKGHNLAKANNVMEVALTTLVNISTNYFSLKDYPTALKHFHEAYHSAHKYKFYSHEVFVCTGLSKIYNAMGDQDNTLLYMRRAETVVKKIQNPNGQQECYSTIANAFEDLGNYKKSYTYLLRYLEFRKLSQTEDLPNKLSAIHASYEIEKNDLETMRTIERTSRLATIGIIAEGIMHDIGNPLNAIKIAADSILYWDKHNLGFLPPIIVNVVQNIADSTNRMDAIIEHMRQFWVDPDTNTEDTFDLNNAIDNALVLVATRIASHGIDLQISTTKDALPVRGKQIYIEQIVINLIFNSIQVLDLATKGKKEISLSTYKKDDWVFIEIKDNGPGLAEDMENRLFEPFATTKNKEENMGLGLAIVKQIVDRFKGSIDTDNSHTNGLTITIGVPLIS